MKKEPFKTQAQPGVQKGVGNEFVNRYLSATENNDLIFDYLMSFYAPINCTTQYFLIFIKTNI